MSKEDQVLKFLLPDLIGTPEWVTDKKGNLVNFTGSEIPPDHYVFFISIEEWNQLKKTSSSTKERKKQ